MKTTVALIGLLTILLAVNRSVKCSQSDKEFQLGDYSGMKCAKIERAFKRTVLSKMICAYLCHRDSSCKSLFYEKTSGLCYGCTNFYSSSSSLETESGTLYYFDKEFEKLITIVRLSNDSGLTNEGRVEVRYNGTWGTVCDDGWLDYLTGHEQNNINVLCGQFGFNNGEILPKKSYPLVDNTTIPIWMDGIACTGTETNIIECPFQGFGDDNCSHSEDLNVRCFND